MSTDHYHHGDLKNAVRTAALEIIAAEGPAAFTMREVARRAGVSHTAPTHHFGDKRRLLTTLATEGFELLGEAMDAAEADDPQLTLENQVAAYVALHVQHPGHAALMWRMDLLDASDPKLGEAAQATFRRLYRSAGSLDPHQRLGLPPMEATLSFWALAHGVAQLADRFTPSLASIVDDDATVPPPVELVRRFLQAVTRS